MHGLFGPRPKGRGVDIMVTMPSEAAHDYGLVRDLLASGMDVARVNCAHDNATSWGDMIANLRRAEKDLGRHCRILMDLGGPKIRTAPLTPGPCVVKWRPKRDLLGRTVAPALVWLYAEDGGDPPPAVADACVPVRGDWLSDVKPGRPDPAAGCTGADPGAERRRGGGRRAVGRGGTDRVRRAGPPAGAPAGE